MGLTRKTNPGTWWGTGQLEGGALVSGQPIPAIGADAAAQALGLPGAGPPGEDGGYSLPQILVASGG